MLSLNMLLVCLDTGTKNTHLKMYLYEHILVKSGFLIFKIKVGTLRRIVYPKMKIV